MKWRMSHVDIQGNSSPSRGNGTVKGLELGMCLIVPESARKSAWLEPAQKGLGERGGNEVRERSK